MFPQHLAWVAEIEELTTRLAQILHNGGVELVEVAKMCRERDSSRLFINIGFQRRLLLSDIGMLYLRRPRTKFYDLAGINQGLGFSSHYTEFLKLKDTGNEMSIHR